MVTQSQAAGRGRPPSRIVAALVGRPIEVAAGVRLELSRADGFRRTAELVFGRCGPDGPLDRPVFSSGAGYYRSTASGARLLVVNRREGATLEIDGWLRLTLLRVGSNSVEFAVDSAAEPQRAHELHAGFRNRYPVLGVRTRRFAPVVQPVAVEGVAVAIGQSLPSG